MIDVDRSMVTFCEETRTLVAEASEIGLRPGEWPDFISVTEPRPDGSRSGFLFLRSRPDLNGGEVAGMRYQQTTGGDLGLLVIND